METHDEITSFEILRLIEKVGEDCMGVVLDTARPATRRAPGFCCNARRPYVRQTHIKDVYVGHATGGLAVVLAELGGNAVLTEMLSKIVARLSLVMSLYEEERKNDCGADHHRLIVSALKAKDLEKAQQLMDHHLADIEGRVRLTEGQGDRHTFLAVLENFS